MLFMNKTKNSKSNIRKFKNKKFDYEKHIKDFYINNGKAHIYANVNDYNDIISKYSIKGYEFLNQNFINYLESISYYIPLDYTIELEISGCNFNDEEKTAIEDCIKHYFGLKLADAEIDLKENRLASTLLLLVSLVLMVFLYLLSKFSIISVFLEFYLVIFWFFIWTYADFEVIDRTKLKQKKLDVAQLASMKVNFTKQY